MIIFALFIYFIVAYSIHSVNGDICSYLSWSTTRNCTEFEGIKRSTLFKVSLLPLGISKFYSGDHFNGSFELAEGFITITSLLVWWCCKRHNVKIISDVLLALALLSCYVLEIIHMICGEQLELFYIITIIISLSLPCVLQCCCSCCCKSTNLIVIVTISTMLLLILTNAFMVYFVKENDGYGCPLIS